MVWQMQNSRRRRRGWRKEKEDPFRQQIVLKYKEEISEILRWEHSFYGAEAWTLRKVDQKYLKSFEMWCWRKMEMSWTESVRNEEVLE
jgi:hypothetical protein